MRRFMIPRVYPSHFASIRQTHRLCLAAPWLVPWPPLECWALLLSTASVTPPQLWAMATLTWLASQPSATPPPSALSTTPKTSWDRRVTAIRSLSRPTMLFRTQLVTRLAATAT